MRRLQGSVRRLAPIVLAALAMSGCVVTETTTNVTSTSATLNGRCVTTTNASATAITWFQYGNTASYGSQTAWQGWGAGVCGAFTTAVSGLTPCVPYHIRACRWETGAASPDCSTDAVFATPPVGGVCNIPASIDATGATEVSTALMRFISGVPSGTAAAPITVRFAANGLYWSDYSIVLRKNGSGSIPGKMWSDNANPSNPINMPQFSLDHVRIDLNNATIEQRTTCGETSSAAGCPPSDPRKHWGDPIISTQGATDVEIFNGTIQGPWPSGQYRPGFEEWTGIRLTGNQETDLVNHLVVRDVSIKDVFGDFVYLAAGKSQVYYGATPLFYPGGRKIEVSALTDVQIYNTEGNPQGREFHTAGRQGIVLNGGSNVQIHDLIIINPDRFAFDSEPGGGQGFSNVTIEDNYITGAGLGFFQFNSGGGSMADHLYIRNNDFGHLTIDLVNNLTLGDGSPNTPRPVFELINNTGVGANPAGGNPLMSVGWWDGVTITGNYDVVHLNNAGNPIVCAVKLKNTVNYTVANNTWVNALYDTCS